MFSTQSLALTNHTRSARADVKPDNLLFSSSGHIRLTDFGLAIRVEDCAAAAIAEGKCDAKAGTPSYLPPVGSALGYANDWWAYGVCILEIIGGTAVLQPLQRAGIEGAPHRFDSNGHLQALAATRVSECEISKSLAEFSRRLLREDTSKRLGCRDPPEAESIKTSSFLEASVSQSPSQHTARRQGSEICAAHI